MTSPLTTIGTVVAAAKLAQGITQGLAREVSGALGLGDQGFHDLLRGDDSPTVEPIRKLTGLITERLAAAGIDVNQPLTIRVTSNGDLQLDGGHSSRSHPGDDRLGTNPPPANQSPAHHPRGAEIESILNSDSEITALAKLLADGPSAVGLTIGPSQGNIPHSSGGYPNW